MKNQFIGFLRRKGFQPIWEKLYHISKIGMNYWNGSSITASGELFVMEYINEKLNSSQKHHILDVGANRGQYATHLSKVLKSDFVIHSFEPSKATFKSLNENIQEAGISDCVKTYNHGFGSKNETLILHSSGEGSCLASVHQLTDTALPFKEEFNEEIILKTIDEFCDENHLSEVAFLKIDVEGHELEVLKGATQLIADKKIKFIQFEFGECHVVSRVFFKDFFDLLSSNYNLHRIVPNGLRAIKYYSSDVEVFSTNNYFAEVK